MSGSGPSFNGGAADPGNVFGGDGLLSRAPDPLGIKSRGGGPMSQQQRMMRQTMGPQRFDTQGPVFGGAGMAGGEREFQPMQEPPEWGQMAGALKSSEQQGAGMGQTMQAAVMPPINPAQQSMLFRPPSPGEGWAQAAMQRGTPMGPNPVLGSLGRGMPSGGMRGRKGGGGP